MRQVQSLVEKLDLGEISAEVAQKAAENVRLMQLKVSDLKKAENARISLAVEIACKSMNVAASRQRLLEQTGVKTKDYIEAYQKCLKFLGLNFDNIHTISVFGIKYGSDDTASDANAILQSFIKREQEQNKYQQPPNFLSALYQGAAFIVAAKLNKLKSVPKREVFFDTLDLSSRTQFIKLCNTMEEMAKSSFHQNGIYEQTQSCSDQPMPDHLFKSGDRIDNNNLQPCNGNFEEQENQSLADIMPYLPQQSSAHMMKLKAEVNEKEYVSSTITSKKGHQSNVQFNNIKSIQIREAEEIEAANKKRKSYEIYCSWKRAILQKHGILPNTDEKPIEEPS